MVLFASDNRKILFRKHQLSFRLEFVKVQGRLHAKYPVERIIQTFLRDRAVPVTFHHVSEIFLFVIEEEIHIASCRDGSRNLLAPWYRSTEHTDHVGCICHDKSVESKLAFQKICDQLGSKCRRSDLLVLDARAQFP